MFMLMAMIYEKVADPDSLNSVKDADILVFVVPHAFVKPICKPLVGKIKSSAVGISLIKVCMKQYYRVIFTSFMTIFIGIWRSSWWWH